MARDDKSIHPAHLVISQYRPRLVLPSRSCVSSLVSSLLLVFSYRRSYPCPHRLGRLSSPSACSSHRFIYPHIVAVHRCPHIVAVLFISLSSFHPRPDGENELNKTARPSVSSNGTPISAIATFHHDDGWQQGKKHTATRQEQDEPPPLPMAMKRQRAR